MDEFSAQGITVLAKSGGVAEFINQIDTAPKENLTVAVSFCGSADVGGITAKILQTALEEKGCVKAKPAFPALPLAVAAIPKEMLKYEGVYFGSRTTKILFDEADNSMKFLKLAGGAFVEQGAFPYKADGRFHLSDTVDIGFTEDSSGTYLLYYVNGSPNSFVIGQRLAPSPSKYNADKIDNVLWLQRNLSYYDLMCAGELRTSAIKDFPGYFDAGGTACRFTSATTATSNLPYSRDALEVTFFDNNGTPWARNFAFLFSDSKDTAVLKPLEKISIGKDGYNEWRSAANDMILDCVVPAKSRLIVTSASGDIVYDSLLNGLKPVVVAKGSFISFISTPGAQFSLR